MMKISKLWFHFRIKWKLRLILSICSRIINIAKLFDKVILIQSGKSIKNALTSHLSVIDGNYNYFKNEIIT